MFCSLLSDIAFSKFNFDYSIFIWIFEKYFIYCRISCPFFSLSNFNLHKLSQLGLCQGYPLLLRMVMLHFGSDNVPNVCSFKKRIMHEFHRDKNFQKSEQLTIFFYLFNCTWRASMLSLFKKCPWLLHLYTKFNSLYLVILIRIYLSIYSSICLSISLSIYLSRHSVKCLFICIPEN